MAVLNATPFNGFWATVSARALNVASRISLRGLGLFGLGVAFLHSIGACQSDKNIRYFQRR